MSKGMFLRFKRNGKFADSIYTRALPYPLGIQDIPALVNEKRSVYSSIGNGEFMRLRHEDLIYLREFIMTEARPGRSINFIDFHDAANWEIEVEEAHW